jgi:hypothetical protein
MSQQPDPIEAFERQKAISPIEAAQPTAPGWHVAEPAGEHVVERREPADKIELLEHDGHTPARVAAKRCNIIVPDPAGAAVRRQETRNTAKQRRFSGATRAENRDELVLAYGETDTLDCRAAVERLGHALNGEAALVVWQNWGCDHAEFGDHTQISRCRSQLDS